MKVKLDPDLKAKLLTKNPSLESAVDDACELLTMKVVLLLTVRMKEIRQRADEARGGTDVRFQLASHAKHIGEIIVLLSETP